MMTTDVIGNGTTAPQLSVVVCTYNRCALLADCLTSLAAQTLPRSAYEVIVVDNNSSDDTAAMVHEWRRANPNVRYVVEPTQGVAHARNCGWRQAAGEFVAYIDDDTVAIPQWCEKILAAFTTIKPTPVAVGGEILPRLEGPVPWWFSPRLEVRSWGASTGFLSSPTAHFGFSGANMAFSRRVLQEYGGFNPCFGMSAGKVWLGEEPELFMRIHPKEPYFWYDPAIAVRHFVPSAQRRIGGRLYRALQAGRARRAMENGQITIGWVVAEAGGVFHLFRQRCAARPFSLPCVIVSLLERVADRAGYCIGRQG